MLPTTVTDLFIGVQTSADNHPTTSTDAPVSFDQMLTSIEVADPASNAAALLANGESQNAPKSGSPQAALLSQSLQTTGGPQAELIQFLDAAASNANKIAPTEIAISTHSIFASFASTSGANQPTADTSNSIAQGDNASAATARIENVQILSALVNVAHTTDPNSRNPNDIDRVAGEQAQLDSSIAPSAINLERLIVETANSANNSDTEILSAESNRQAVVTSTPMESTDQSSTTNSVEQTIAPITDPDLVGQTQDNADANSDPNPVLNAATDSQLTDIATSMGVDLGDLANTSDVSSTDVDGGAAIDPRTLNGQISIDNARSTDPSLHSQNRSSGRETTTTNAQRSVMPGTTVTDQSARSSEPNQATSAHASNQTTESQTSSESATTRPDSALAPVTATDARDGGEVPTDRSGTSTSELRTANHDPANTASDSLRPTTTERDDGGDRTSDPATVASNQYTDSPQSTDPSIEIGDNAIRTARQPSVQRGTANVDPIASVRVDPAQANSAQAPANQPFAASQQSIESTQEASSENPGPAGRQNPVAPSSENPVALNPVTLGSENPVAVSEQQSDSNGTVPLTNGDDHSPSGDARANARPTPIQRASVGPSQTQSTASETPASANQEATDDVIAAADAIQIDDQVTTTSATDSAANRPTDSTATFAESATIVQTQATNQSRQRENESDLESTGVPASENVDPLSIDSIELTDGGNDPNDNQPGSNASTELEPHASEPGRVTADTRGRATFAPRDATTQAASINATPQFATQSIRSANPNATVSRLDDTLAGLRPIEVTQQVVTAMSKVIQNADDPSMRSVSLELHPEELGHLKIQVEQTAEKIVTHIIASELISTDLLNSQKDVLLDALAELGFDDASVDVSHEENRQAQSELQTAQQETDNSKQQDTTTTDPKPSDSTSSSGLNIVA
ncbi:MAG: hypothetical protein HKN47_16850 [Pirellulaceae bacterium]|nr:hypothetical protein [Pirellulaceae bacterium]